MQDRDLFALALGLGKPWFVSSGIQHGFGLIMTTIFELREQRRCELFSFHDWMHEINRQNDVGILDGIWLKPRPVTHLPARSLRKSSHHCGVTMVSCWLKLLVIDANAHSFASVSGVSTSTRSASEPATIGN